MFNWSEIKLALRVLISPSCWTRMGTYNHYWDKMLRDLIQHESILPWSEHIRSVGGYRVWINDGTSQGNFKIPDNTACSKRTFLLWRDAVKKSEISAGYEPQWYTEYRAENSKLNRALK